MHGFFLALVIYSFAWWGIDTAQTVTIVLLEGFAMDPK